MRWCIDLEDNAYCDFEFCCSKDMSQKGLELMYAINPDGLNRNTAKVYFDRCYGGQQLTNTCIGQIFDVTFCAIRRTKATNKNFLVEVGVKNTYESDNR